MTDRDMILDYLTQRWRAFVHGEGNVPCGDCRGCCRAGYTIGLSRAEAARLPHSLLEGHAVILPLPNGRCPLLGEDDNCTVYTTRPAACRQFDCRDLALGSVRIREDVRSSPGVAEINRSVERHFDSYGQKAIVPLSRQAEIFINDFKLSSVAATQAAVGIGITQMLGEEKSQAFQHAVLGQEERERGLAQAAFDRTLEPNGKPS